jgi:hypothetical protein
MTHRFSKIAALAAAAIGTCVTAIAAPVAIDSEQKANAAVLSAQKALTVPKQDLERFAGYARSIAENALEQLAAATTPVALVNSRSGIVLACATSGDLTARMARTFPRVLKLSWQACAFNDLDGNPHVRNGTAEIILLSDSFTPEKVAGIRFGTRSSDFTDTRHIDDPEQITDELRSVNLRLIGQIPMTRAFPRFGVFVGEFAFEMTGFIQEEFRAEIPGSGQPAYEQTSRAIAEFVIATGATTYNSAKTHSVEDLRLHFGKMTQTSSSPNFPEVISVYTLDGLKIRHESDFVAFSGSKTVDGKIEFQYAPQAGACLSGAYVIKTRAPLVSNSLFSFKYDAGELLINGSTTAQFFSAANVPPTLPVPQLGVLVHLDVRNVGVFNYDAPDLSILAQNAQCFGG